MKPESAKNLAYGLSLATCIVMLVSFALHKNYGINADWLLLLILMASL